mgnify:CR=1 FL=1|jgi:endogenous inhibitor of DNA gyrase (YacG/DUF329 family)
MNDLQREHIVMLRNSGGSYSEISRALGISINTIKSFCRRNNLGGRASQRSLNENIQQIYCKMCGKRLEMKPNRKPKMFCSDACRLAWWKSHPELINRKAVYHFICAYCGKEFDSYGNKKRKYCSHSCYIKARFGNKAKREKTL